MFNYLAVEEKTFHKNDWGSEYHETRLEFKIFKQLFVPFSSKSFGQNDRLIKHLTSNVKGLLFNFTAFLEANGLNDFLISQLLSPFIIAKSAVGLSFDLTILALSLVTRSLTTLFYMASYQVFGAPNKDTSAPFDRENYLRYPSNKGH